MPFQIRQGCRARVLGMGLALAMVAAASPPAAADGGTITGEVNAKPAKYRQGAVVYLEKVPGAFRPPLQPVPYDQRGMTFLPHVLAVMRGTTVRFQNNDNVSHNIFTPDGDKYNLGTWGQGENKNHVFTKAGVYRQLCNVHPEMEGFIVVVDNPFFAVTGEDGKFRLDGVPPGTYSLRTWSEKLPAVSQPVTVTAGGSATVRIELKKP